MPAFQRRRLLAVAAWLCLPAPAFAHAILEQSEPATGAGIPEGPVALRFRFNSRIDRARSVLTLIRPDKSRVVLPILQSGPPEIVETATTLSPGAYVVRWQVLAVDGHITRGDVPFVVTGR